MRPRALLGNFSDDLRMGRGDLPQNEESSLDITVGDERQNSLGALLDAALEAAVSPPPDGLLEDKGVIILFDIDTQSVSRRASPASGNSGGARPPRSLTVLATSGIPARRGE